LRWALSSLASSGEEANHKITSSKMVVDRETRSEKMPSKILKGIRDPRRRGRGFGGQDGWFCRYAWDFCGSQWKSNLPEGCYFTSQLTSCARKLPLFEILEEQARTRQLIIVWGHSNK
jgi:hypothetical protein